MAQSERNDSLANEISEGNMWACSDTLPRTTRAKSKSTWTNLVRREKGDEDIGRVRSFKALS